MKQLFIITTMLFAFISLNACTPTNSEPVTTNTSGQSGNTENTGEDNAGNNTENENTGNDNTENNENEGDTIMNTNKIRITTGNSSFTATLADNSSSEALKQRLAQGNVSIRMNDYGDMEKVGSLGFSLPRNDRQTTTGPGDLILYQGNSFVIYYDSNSWSFTKLGKVDNVSTREQMLQLLGGKGEITVTLSLEQ